MPCASLWKTKWPRQRNRVAPLPPRLPTSRATKWRTSPLTWQSMSMILRRSTRTRKKTKSTLMWVYNSKLRISRQARRMLSNRCSSASNNSSRKTTRMMKMKRKYLVPTTLLSMQTYQFLKSSRRCLSTFSVISLKRLIWRRSSSHSSQTTSQLSVKWTLSSRCPSQTARRKIWESPFLMNLAWIMRIRPYWSSSTCRVRT